MVRCPDLVMSAMSYHRRYCHGKIARAYWSFVAQYQNENGYLRRRRGQWYLVELASRFPFQSIRVILSRNINWAMRRQQRDGGFQKENSATSACQVVQAYSRHGMLQVLLAKLRYDPIPLVESVETPLGLKTRREALEEREDDDNDLSKRLIHRIAEDQLADGSWGGLIVSTAQAIHDLLDCGSLPETGPVRKGCSWLLEQQQSPKTELFPNTPSMDLPGMFYTTKMQEEMDCFNELYPEYASNTRDKTCLILLPIFQTGATLAALCRSGLVENPGVERGFQDLLQIRGPGGQYYTHHWCACDTKRWIHTNKPKFDEKTYPP